MHRDIQTFEQDDAASTYVELNWTANSFNLQSRRVSHTLQHIPYTIHQYNNSKAQLLKLIIIIITSRPLCIKCRYMCIRIIVSSYHHELNSIPIVRFSRQWADYALRHATLPAAILRLMISKSMRLTTSTMRRPNYEYLYIATDRHTTAQLCN